MSKIYIFIKKSFKSLKWHGFAVAAREDRKPKY